MNKFQIQEEIDLREEQIERINMFYFEFPDNEREFWTQRIKDHEKKIQELKSQL